jgi:nucleoid DNA-binding protein
MTKNELYTTLSDKTGLAKKDVASLFEHLDELVRTSLTKRGGPKQFVLPGLLKIRLAEKKATPAKKGRNPQTGEIINIPAKPKRNTVKVTPLKALKDSVLTGK